MTAEQDYAAHIVDLLEGFGHCEARDVYDAARRNPSKRNRSRS